MLNERPVVAVEAHLHNIASFLAERGYEVVPLEDRVPDHADAVVVSGGDDNLMGMQDAETKAPVIRAAGLTPDDIVRALDQRLR